MEKNFVNENGFIKVRNWYFPTLSPHGRSLSIRITNIADFMTNEIQRATESLNRVKKVEWEQRAGTTQRKFSAFISTSRSNYEAILPMWDYKYLQLVKKMWLLSLRNELSTSVFEDYEENFEEIIKGLTKKGNIDMLERILGYILLRNNGRELLEDFKIEPWSLHIKDYESSIYMLRYLKRSG